MLYVYGTIKILPERFILIDFKSLSPRILVLTSNFWGAVEFILHSNSNILVYLWSLYSASAKIIGRDNFLKDGYKMDIFSFSE